ncbi:calcineurin phosphoesterase [Luteimonas yindakuii]|uniref:Calcineurin phosphoesterase n=1 Tax=Luteimonas yindakuii TaxID=2565782 RepID=A0A4Z1R4N1_9GAMM|nr:calcineurin-like phosphoesterase C-terminal domain-containing protein [Luteimonas yindakuii]TKS53876.1 calcineurin phosphoesterase [Luteimonas yindakuii]
MRTPILLALLLSTACGTVAASCRVGRVVDTGGEGIASIRVSDGRQLVATGVDGRFAFAAPPQAPVFVIKPAGHAVPAGSNGLPDFWRRPDAADCTFVLRAEPVARDALEVLVFSDPQTSDLREVGYYREDVVAPLAGRHTAALGVTLGDVANDDLTLYPAINAVTAQLGVPWLHVAGNHDLDAGTDATSLHSFQAIYGPDTFAWEEPEAVFVGLDNVIAQPEGGPGHIGGLRPDQFEFLEAYLPTVAHDRLLVLSMHVPLFDAPAGRETFRAGDRQRLYGLLATHPRVLVLSGHRHTLQHVFHNAADGWPGREPLHEFNVGAVSGAFWSGAPDAGGIPDATMADGTPNGHATLVVRAGGDYALAWHPARLDAADDATTAAMALHAPRRLRRGAYPAWGVYANVYMGLPETRVEFRVGGGDWQPMRRIEAPDPRLTVENARDDLADALRGRDRSPEAAPSTHLWRGALPTDLPAGTHRVEVRAFDLWQGEQRASTTYSLEEWVD